MFSMVVNRLYCKDFMICTAAIIFLFVHFLQESYRPRLTGCPKYCYGCCCCHLLVHALIVFLQIIWYEVTGEKLFKLAKMYTRCSFLCNFSCNIYIVLIHVSEYMSFVVILPYQAYREI